MRRSSSASTNASAARGRRRAARAPVSVEALGRRDLPLERALGPGEHRGLASRSGAGSTPARSWKSSFSISSERRSRTCSTGAAAPAPRTPARPRRVGPSVVRAGPASLALVPRTSTRPASRELSRARGRRAGACTSRRDRSHRPARAPARPPSRAQVPRRAGRAPPIRPATAPCAACRLIGHRAGGIVGSQLVSTTVVGSHRRMDRTRFLAGVGRASAGRRRRPAGSIGGAATDDELAYRELRRLGRAPRRGLLREALAGRLCPARAAVVCVAVGRRRPRHATGARRRCSPAPARRAAACGGLRVRVAAAAPSPTAAPARGRPARRAAAAARRLPERDRLRRRSRATACCTRASPRASASRSGRSPAPWGSSRSPPPSTSRPRARRSRAYLG